MNSLVLLPNEIQASGQIVLQGARAKEFYADHNLPLGSKVAASILGGSRGEVEVLELSQSKVILSGIFAIPPIDRQPIVLIVAISRPQTIRKVLQLAASVGVESLYFVLSGATQKSYIQSKMLLPENIEYHLRLGMQQSFDSIAPKISIYASINKLFEELSSNSKEKDRYFAHTPRYQDNATQEVKLWELPYNRNAGSIIAIGPEAGWSDVEVREFTKAGFKMISLGNRTYRVEVALAITIGQLQALKASSNS